MDQSAPYDPVRRTATTERLLAALLPLLAVVGAMLLVLAGANPFYAIICSCTYAYPRPIEHPGVAR